MKTTRLILALAAALSLGLAVFANVRTHSNATASTQSTIISDEVVTSRSDADSAATGTKVAGSYCDFAGSAANGIQLAGSYCDFAGSAANGIQLAGSYCDFAGQTPGTIAS
jgi:hypothetical protein